MKNITTNKLQSELSRAIKEVDRGEIYQISRYSKPVAYLVSKKEFEKLVSGNECKRCVEDLRKIARKVK